MVCIYIIQLENNKYYIGKTNNPICNRILDHFNNIGSVWTSKYKPIRVIDIFYNCDDYDEDKYTFIYMEKYGINNVRGGTFCKLNLDKNDINQITKQIRGYSNKCYYCGKSDHFVNYCPSKLKTINQTLVCNRCNRSGHKSINCYANKKKNGDDIQNIEQPLFCGRCNRSGHKSGNCYANNIKENIDDVHTIEQPVVCHKSGNCYANNIKEHIDDMQTIENPMVCHKCNLSGHKSIYCYANKTVNVDEYNCYRCGRNTHWRITCSESIDIYGNTITDSNNCYIS